MKTMRNQVFEVDQSMTVSMFVEHGGWNQNYVFYIGIRHWKRLELIQFFSNSAFVMQKLQFQNGSNGVYSTSLTRPILYSRKSCFRFTTKTKTCKKDIQENILMHIITHHATLSKCNATFTYSFKLNMYCINLKKNKIFSYEQIDDKKSLRVN